MSELQRIQKQLADHIRNPESCVGPDGIEPRRLGIYAGLFYRNIESFLSGGFPVMRSLFSDERWHALVRDFMVSHRCQSPYFLQISEEFLGYLFNERQPAASDPPFLRELAHYEWVELALDVAEAGDGELRYDVNADLMGHRPVVSPLSWSLGYQYPVHRIGATYQPSEPPEQPTYLVVYRNQDEEVKFLESNALTARLLELLQPEAGPDGRETLLLLAKEIHHPDPEGLLQHGQELLCRLRELGIILGGRPAAT